MPLHVVILKWCSSLGPEPVDMPERCRLKTIVSSIIFGRWRAGAMIPMDLDFRRWLLHVPTTCAPSVTVNGLVSQLGRWIQNCSSPQQTAFPPRFAATAIALFHHRLRLWCWKYSRNLQRFILTGGLSLPKPGNDLKMNIFRFLT